MTFETQDTIYSTIKAEATIAFTKEGIEMDGINKQVKKTSD